MNYALSYLHGSMLEWFKPNILSPNCSTTWLDDFDEFKMDLHTNFSPFDPVSDAKDCLDNISMKDNQHIIKYVIAFNRFAG